MNIGTMEQRTNGMKKQANELIEQAYKRGYKAGQENALTVDSNKFREQGRNEAWEAMRTIIGLGEPLEVCGATGFRGFVCGVSASEAISKIQAYKEQKKQEEEETSNLHIGDEVTFLTIGGEIITGVVTGEYSDTHEFRVMRATDGGECYCCKAKKTGRHFPKIAEVLKKMQEGKE